MNNQGGNYVNPILYVLAYGMAAIIAGNVIYFIYCLATGQDVSWFADFLATLFQVEKPQ